MKSCVLSREKARISREADEPLSNRKHAFDNTHARTLQVLQEIDGVLSDFLASAVGIDSAYSLPTLFPTFSPFPSRRTG